MAEIEWKGAIWKAAYGDLSVKDLLTILKGFGPMEVLEFKRGEPAGGRSVCVNLRKAQKRSPSTTWKFLAGSVRGRAATPSSG